MTALHDIREQLHKDLADISFTTKDERDLFAPGGKTFKWFFDIKGIMLRPGNLKRISSLFWEHIKEQGPVQLGGLETVAIALISGIVMRAEEDSRSLNAFYVRKSRKRDGMQRHIEGALTDEPVILIDDGLNSGKSIVRQVEALKAEGKRVVEICVILAFRDPAFYTYFTDNNIRIWSIFTLDDFPRSGGLLASPEQQVSRPNQPYRIEWKFTSDKPAYHIVIPKSAPVIDDERLYFGADNGVFWALNQSDGSVAWSHKTLFGAGKKRIFSSPALHNGMVYFGAYDGNFYALDAQTGEKRWVNLESDWIGSSPCVADDIGTVFVGLEFGLWKKQGGLAAFDAHTGEKKWWYQVETHVHSSPAYSQRYGTVVVGSRSGEVFAFNARSGELLWRFSESSDVKGGLAFDEDRGYVIFGSWDDHIYILNVHTGERIHAIPSYKPIYSTPVMYKGRLYMGLLDKRIVCVDPEKGALLWQYETHSRVFPTPAFINDSLYCGSNDGRLYELDPETGAERSFFQFTERIVNKVAYNPITGRIFVPTFANEIYCMEKLANI